MWAQHELFWFFFTPLTFSLGRPGQQAARAALCPLPSWVCALTGQQGPWRAASVLCDRGHLPSGPLFFFSNVENGAQTFLSGF